MSSTSIQDHIRSFTRFVYITTEEEDRTLLELQETLKKHENRVWTFNAVFGLVPLGQLIKDWSNRAHETSKDAATIHDALEKVYKDNPKDAVNFYIFTDPERYLKDEHVQRRILNIAHQLHADNRTIKILIFVGQRRFIPERLARYIHVVQDKGMTSEKIQTLLSSICSSIDSPVPEDSEQLFKGMTSFEIEASVSQSIIATRKKDKNERRIDPTFIRDYKRGQLLKTDLVQYCDTSEYSFDVLGGAARFKTWADQNHAVWTKEGRNFGLKVPKGILLVGVHGCGKSLSVKALGQRWGLPVVSLEMGRLRSSGVGDSEANVYRALRVVESVSPCILWIDEAEKSLAGGQSSAQSDAGTTSRTLGILSTWVQEHQSDVCIAMTANSLDTMPVEMVNRMSTRWFFDIPNIEERIDILKIHLKKNRQNSDEFNLANLSEASTHLVGREIEQAIEEAMVKSFNAKSKTLVEDILLNELRTKPRIVKTMTTQIKSILEWVGYDPEIDDGIRARMASAKRGDSVKVLSNG